MTFCRCEEGVLSDEVSHGAIATQSHVTCSTHCLKVSRDCFAEFTLTSEAVSKCSQRHLYLINNPVTQSNNIPVSDPLILLAAKVKFRYA
jgi:hypothetical protein